MTIRILTGDCRDVLPTLEANSVHCVVTSPPYYGLRDYGTAQWDGGDAGCDHTRLRCISSSTLKNDGRAIIGTQPHEKQAQIGTPYLEACGKCGARRIDRQLGLEATPDAYIQTMVEVFREVRRVLRDDGTCWVNMGDSYANGGGEKRDGGHGFVDGGKAKLEAAKGALLSGRWSDPVMKPKDLMMMPARLALALQADGWWLRSDIIWAKPNPMPESVTDRPTSAHEHVFLLTKAARYFYDADAVREEHAREWDASNGGNMSPSGQHKANGAYRERGGSYPLPNPAGRNARNVWTIATAPFSDWGETVRQVRVAWDAGVDGMKRKASPDCPVHADRPVPDASARGGERGGDHPVRSERTAIDPAQAQQGGSVPIAPHHGQAIAPSMLDLLGQPCDLSAIDRSSRSHRTDLVPATSPACSASAQTADDTAHIPASPSPFGSVGHTRGSNSEQDGSGDRPSAQIGNHSADMSSCCCEWYIEKTEKTSHFATFPPELAERCIKAGTSERGCCAQCGKPWVRQSDTSYERNRHGHSGRTDASGSNGWDGGGYPNLRRVSTTTGWSSGCQCNAEVAPCVVLDPFSGAGTSGLVADRLGRDAVMIDLNHQYVEMARERLQRDCPLFADITDAPVPEPPEDERMADLFAEAAE